MKIFPMLVLIIFLALVQCSDEKPDIDPNLTFSSTPVEGVLPFFKGENLDPYWSSDGKLPSDLKKIPKITFTSSENLSFNQDKFIGKYSLITFFYAKCSGICPMITRNLLNFYPRLQSKENVQIVSISINPEVDTVPELLKFKRNYKIDHSNWHFLTGKKDVIYDFARNEFSADVKVIKGYANLNDFVHTENIFLIDKKGYLRGVYRAKGKGDLDRLLIELETLRLEG